MYRRAGTGLAANTNVLPVARSRATLTGALMNLEAPSAGGTLRLRVRIAMGYRRGNLELALISRI
jgi:hypothetical protein